MDIKVAKVEDSYIVEMLKFTDFIFIFSLLLPNFAKIKSVKLKIKYVALDFPIPASQANPSSNHVAQI